MLLTDILILPLDMLVSNWFVIAARRWMSRYLPSHPIFVSLADPGGSVRDARTTESGLRDLTTQSGREWPRNRLYGMRRRCIRHKPRERRENSTCQRSDS